MSYITEKEDVYIDLEMLHVGETPMYVKLDPNGLPLVPQPLDHFSDPLNWSQSKKLVILALMSAMSFFGGFNMAMMNPSYAQVAIVLHKTVVQTSYIGTIGIAGVGVACFVWSPLANVYGRRPILVVAQMIAVIAGFASSFTENYTHILVARFLAGIGHGAVFVLSVVVVGDIFFVHERGKMIGIVTVSLINGPHAAALPGGYVARFISWHWTLLLPSIISAIFLVILVVVFPETLYLRGPKYTAHKNRDTYFAQRRLWGFRHPLHHLRFMDFARPIQMLKYWPVVAVSLHSGVTYTLGSVMPSLTASALFHASYGWNISHIGLALSISTTVGTAMGEIVAGPVTDQLMLRARKHARGEVKPEARLHAMWPGIILLPLGLILYGCMIRFFEIKNSWVGACVGMGLTCFSVQVISTPAIAYVVDCYKPQAAHSVQLLNFTRQLMGFTVGFWSINFGNRVGFQFSGLTYALVSIVFFIPVGLTMLYGERIRNQLGI